VPNWFLCRDLGSIWKTNPAPVEVVGRDWSAHRSDWDVSAVAVINFSCCYPERPQRTLRLTKAHGATYEGWIHIRTLGYDLILGKFKDTVGVPFMGVTFFTF
jgi:hypothetical protein